MEEDKKKKIIIKKKKPIIKVKVKSKVDESIPDQKDYVKKQATDKVTETIQKDKQFTQKKEFERDKFKKDSNFQKKEFFDRNKRDGIKKQQNYKTSGQDFKSDNKDQKTPIILDKYRENKKIYKGDWKKKKIQQEEFFEREKEKEFEFQKKNKITITVPPIIEISETILVKDLAKKMNIKVGDLIAKLLGMGYIATINDALDKETAEIIANEFGCKVILKSIYEALQKLEDFQDQETGTLHPRPPIVTIMGHVDHGKTSLLDYIRKTKVAAKEAGGITQHIGAYQVEIPKGKITFIDTPGHAAFTMMRERGAAATDIVILVVAADDGVMPQTVEALDHAKAANVPIIVAMNKIDKENSNPEKVKQQLSEIGLIPEEWGGKTICVPVSATKGLNIDKLLESILLEAEMADLKANPKKRAKGFILETQMDKSRGAAATVIIKDGTLKKGDFFIAGTENGKIRAMFDYAGKEIKEAPPSTPVEIIGFDTLPESGDIFQAVSTEKISKEISQKRKEIKRIEQAKKVSKKASLDDLYQQMQIGQKVEFNVIIKADVQGTAEAIKKMITNLSDKISEIKIKVIHCSVGAITENDVTLASASKSVIIGFNVRPNTKVAQMAKEKGIEIRKYNIIYHIVDDIKSAVEGMLKPEEKEVILGQVEVRETFKVPKIGLIAGCYVTEGFVKRSAKIRVIRDGIVIHDGKISSLKRFKDDVKDVQKGYECGIGLESYNDLREKDIFEVYEIQETARKLMIESDNS